MIYAGAVATHRDRIECTNEAGEVMPDSINGRFNVGGVLLDRPFKVRRLGHFGFNMSDAAGALDFYTRLLGFRVSDPLDFANVAPDPKIFEGLTETTGYFLNHGSDHHSHVIFPRTAIERLAVARGGRVPPADVTVNQITWQVGSLREVGDAISWLGGLGIRIARLGRDTPGSNWHGYPIDPEGHTNELYYGIEQIGWNGRSKPSATYKRGFHEQPDLPQIAEYTEIEQFAADDMDLMSGYRHIEKAQSKYDVGGVLLARPFKITRVGPVRLFAHDVDAMAEFYADRLGFTLTEEVEWEGHRCLFLRCNTEHHSLALYPIGLRDVLGLSPHTTCLSFGVQLGDFQQLRAAIEFLEAEGVTIKYLPTELFPGIDYSAFAIDPDGHAIQLYYYMEQVGWDGRPRSSETRRLVDNGKWPKALEPLSDTFQGEPFLGPLG